MHRQNGLEIMEELSTKICLLHLIAVGELGCNADLRDSVQWFYDCKEKCSNCKYNETCLVYRFSEAVTK